MIRKVSATRCSDCDIFAKRVIIDRVHDSGESMSDFCCPLCLKDAKAKKAKPLYGTKVCKKCYYGLANRRQFAYLIDLFAWWPIGFGVTAGAELIMTWTNFKAIREGLLGQERQWGLVCCFF